MRSFSSLSDYETTLVDDSLTGTGQEEAGCGFLVLSRWVVLSRSFKTKPSSQILEQVWQIKPKCC